MRKRGLLRPLSQLDQMSGKKRSIEEEEMEDEVMNIIALPKPKYDPSKPLPVPEKDAPVNEKGEVVQPLCEYRSIADAWRKQNPGMYFADFKERIGKVPENGKKTPPYKLHESYIAAVELFNKALEKTQQEKAEFSSKYPMAAEYSRLKALKKRYENKSNPKIAEERQKKREEMAAKRRRDMDEMNTEKMAKRMQYMPDNISVFTRELEQSIQKRNMDMIKLVSEVNIKNMEDFSVWDSKVHAFYKSLNN